MKNKLRKLVLFLVLALTLTGFNTALQLMQQDADTAYAAQKKSSTYSEKFSLKEIPSFTDSPYAVVNNNQPFFTKSDYTTKAFEKYSKLDKLKRCGITYANVCKDIMPTEERGKIGSVKPTGWQTVKYDCVDGKYLYNRCHLIGYQLSAENANKKNLITGTRYFNVEGMLPFENMVADYVKETDNHVLYRVTPIFEGDNLVASGVLMEAYSVEDKGEGVSFCVYCYNVQPGVTIDYATGKSSLSSDKANTTKNDTTKESTKKETISKDTTNKNNTGTVTTFVINMNTKKFHKMDCSSAKRIAKKNYKEYKGTAQELINQGYSPCKNCHPEK